MSETGEGLGKLPSSAWSWEFNPSMIATSGAITTGQRLDAPAGEGGIVEALKRVQVAVDSLPKPDFDVIVCTRQRLPELQLRALSPTPPTVAGALGGLCNSIMGIPLYVCESRDEAFAVCLRLREQGKRPALVE